MKMVLPNSAKLNVAVVKSKRKRGAQIPILMVMVKFTYEETFTNKDAMSTGFTVKQLLENTYAALKPHLKAHGLKFKQRGNRVQISGTIPREQFGNMMLSEFMSWGTIGSVTISELFIGAMVSSSGVKMLHSVPSVSASMPEMSTAMPRRSGK